MSKYVITNLKMAISDRLILNNSWSRFVEFSSQSKVVFQLLMKEELPRFYGVYEAKLEHDNGYLFINGSDITTVTEDWGKGYILNQETISGIDKIIQQFFYTHAVQRHMIQLHSSLIATTDNRGLMFLGPSGIGKTTQAELWHKYRDALIINGDIVFVQETEDAFLGWGTPWHGSSPYCENTNVPVEALVVLKQAPENSIRELTGFEKVSEVSNSVFYPRWLENGMELCLETLDHLLSKLPVYELRCRPDEDAVRLTEETIFKN